MTMSLKERAYEHIWENMASGALAPGSRLSDVELARQIGISRTPVREALILLETQGLVEQVAGLGPHVKELDRREFDEALELREMLESSAAAKAAERISDQEVEQLQAICGQFLEGLRKMRDENIQSTAHPLFERHVLLDMAFHVKLIGAARNRRLLQLVSDLHVLGRILRLRAEMPSVSLLRRGALVYRDHLRIVRALRKRDSRAAQHWVSRHIERARQYHLDAFDWQQRQRSLRGEAQSDLPAHVQRLLSRMETSTTPEAVVANHVPPSEPVIESGRRRSSELKSGKDGAGPRQSASRARRKP